MVQPNRFNIRVYGILLNENQEVLVMDERRFGMNMTKFPGGGLEFGEGISDALKREWKEELSIDIQLNKLFYVNEFFQASAFRETDQLISIYYLVEPLEKFNPGLSQTRFDFPETDADAHSLRVISLETLSESDFTFPVDKEVAEKLKLFLQ